MKLKLKPRKRDIDAERLAKKREWALGIVVLIAGMAGAFAVCYLLGLFMTPGHY